MVDSEGKLLLTEENSRVYWHVTCTVVMNMYFDIEVEKGRPPTPTPTTAIKEASAMKLGAPPAASPNIPAMSKVMLKDHLVMIAWSVGV